MASVETKHGQIIIYHYYYLYDSTDEILRWQVRWICCCFPFLINLFGSFFEMVATTTNERKEMSIWELHFPFCIAKKNNETMHWMLVLNSQFAILIFFLFVSFAIDALDSNIVLFWISVNSDDHRRWHHQNRKKETPNTNARYAPLVIWQSDFQRRN